MNVEEGARLRIQWSVQRLGHCPHESLSAEKIGHYQDTGAYLCTACGESFQTTELWTNMSDRTQETTPIADSSMQKKCNLPPAALVLEDDPMMTLLCARALESLGFQALCCNTSFKAANAAHLHDYRIQFMLVDVVLATPAMRLRQTQIHPKDDGTRLLPLLQHVCSHAVAVQMSAYSLQELTEQGYHVDVEYFLQKPFTPPTLRRLVHDLLPNLKIPSRPILPISAVTWCG